MAKIVISDIHEPKLDNSFLAELSSQESDLIVGGGLLGRIIGSVIGGVAGFLLAGPAGIIGGISAGGALGDEIQDAL
ncbi:hypothetical protein H6G54_17255 [Anabaena cylindrica FACHB-243]|uniref:hypothetical protein n=1 Tax=Anabaena TaxID=1163 RepID=UPI000B60CEF1|nr:MULTISPECIES: hypothetical protein [Anabaena]BAY00839.1 hypothetical protein NIES19_00650 [Anabaena cylindrica PCC 7122]MBD2419415.1 hypothetical protein [Anabaena cylindrica FACHB-243]MBY5283177.1 hypothetical protein [Anabaena sp. CCAP 1446/1C]MBY5310724.1 hypothetical protein [Anabaena sp. CCAP 1446/1C]MCM2408963.1 hypothetical protein [Anabaena sp. CCAP 1446/1C]